MTAAMSAGGRALKVRGDAVTGWSVIGKKANEQNEKYICRSKEIREAGGLPLACL